MSQPVDQPPHSSRRLEPGEERRRVGVVESRTATDREQMHLDDLHQPAAHRLVEVGQIAHRHERHRVKRRGDPAKPATLSVGAQGSQDR